MLPEAIRNDQKQLDYAFSNREVYWNRRVSILCSFIKNMVRMDLMTTVQMTDIFEAMCRNKRMLPFACKNFNLFGGYILGVTVPVAIRSLLVISDTGVVCDILQNLDYTLTRHARSIVPHLPDDVCSVVEKLLLHDNWHVMRNAALFCTSLVRRWTMPPKRAALILDHLQTFSLCKMSKANTPFLEMLHTWATAHKLPRLSTKNWKSTAPLEPNVAMRIATFCADYGHDDWRIGVSNKPHPLHHPVSLELVATLSRSQHLFRQRLVTICSAFGNLRLPTLMLLGIIDEHFENELTMYIKWKYIVLIRHFHDRKAIAESQTK